jgi:hypothetical protein
VSPGNQWAACAESAESQQLGLRKLRIPVGSAEKSPTLLLMLPVERQQGCSRLLAAVCCCREQRFQHVCVRSSAARLEDSRALPSKIRLI